MWNEHPYPHTRREEGDTLVWIGLAKPNNGGQLGKYGCVWSERKQLHEAERERVGTTIRDREGERGSGMAIRRPAEVRGLQVGCEKPGVGSVPLPPLLHNYAA